MSGCARVLYASNRKCAHPAAQRRINPPPLLLVRDGRLLRRNRWHEMRTDDELLSAMRQSGINDSAQVKRAHLEGNGEFSFITLAPSQEWPVVRYTGERPHSHLVGMHPCACDHASGWKGVQR